MAFTQNKAPTYPLQPNVGSLILTHALGTALETVYTVGGDGASDINSFIATSTDSVAHDIQIWRTNSTGPTSWLLGTVNVPLGAGNTSSVPSVNLLAGLVGLMYDANGNPVIRLTVGDTLQVAAVVAVTAADFIYFTVSGEDY